MADYDINAVTRRKVFTGSAGTGPYAFTFEILTASDIVVYFNATKLTLTTDFTVAINANGTGSVTIVVNAGGNVPQTPVAADQIVVIGARDIERTTDFVTAGDLLASSLNEQLDALTIFDQQIAEENQRGMRAPPYDPALVEDGGVVDMTLPAKASRAGKTLAFDSDGNPTVGEDIGNWRGDWAAGTAYTVRDLVKDPVNESIYRVNTAHTSSGSAPISGNADVAKFDLVIDATAVADAEAAQAAAEAAQAAAETAETNAASSATSSANSATASASSATASAASESAAATSEANASTSESNAASSATSSANSATASASSATASAASASAASTSESNASTSESNAASSASSASTSAATATTQAGIATTKAGEASTSASNAATSETNAATSESNASTSASNAAASATSAANSAASAAASFDSFDDRYLGAKSSDPTVDNDGNALVEGALYFSSTDNEMKVYDGANWIAASSAGSASLILYEYTATSGQTTFSGSDDNAATLSYTANNIQVVMNGVILDPSDYTATNGTSVVLAAGATTGDLVNIYAFKSFTVADTVSASAGGTFNANVAFNANATFGDNDKAIFGAGSDLQVYHDGGNSLIQDAGDGDLILKSNGAATVIKTNAGNNLISARDAGSVGVFHNGSEKLTTSATGIDVTGTGHFYNSTAPTLNNDTHAGEALFLKSGGTAGNGNVQAVLAFGKADGSTNRSGSAIGSIQTDTDVDKIGIGFYTSDGSASSQTMDERMRLDAAGNLTLSSGILQAIGVYNNTTGSGANVVVDSGGGFARSTSSQRYKNTIADATHGLTELLTLRPVTYKHNNSGDTVFGGLIAEEVHAAGLTEFVQYSEDENGNDQPEALDYANMVSLCIKAIQEQQATITALEARITALEAE